jgi:hypothetical protein
MCVVQNLVARWMCTGVGFLSESRKLGNTYLMGILRTSNLSHAKHLMYIFGLRFLSQATSYSSSSAPSHSCIDACRIKPVI